MLLLCICTVISHSDTNLWCPTLNEMWHKPGQINVSWLLVHFHKPSLFCIFHWIQIDCLTNKKRNGKINPVWPLNIYKCTLLGIGVLNLISFVHILRATPDFSKVLIKILLKSLAVPWKPLAIAIHTWHIIPSTTHPTPTPPFFLTVCCICQRLSRAIPDQMTDK